MMLVISCEFWFSDIEQGVQLVCEKGIRVVVSFGGGVVIDVGKVIVVLVFVVGLVIDYLEVVGMGCQLEVSFLLFVVIFIIVGMGVEVIKNVVINVLEQQWKVSLCDD